MRMNFSLGNNLNVRTKSFHYLSVFCEHTFRIWSIDFSISSPCSLIKFAVFSWYDRMAQIMLWCFLSLFFPLRIGRKEMKSEWESRVLVTLFWLLLTDFTQASVEFIKIQRNHHLRQKLLKKTTIEWYEEKRPKFDENEISPQLSVIDSAEWVYRVNLT